MTQLCSLQQAARNALARYLTTELAPVAGGAGVVCAPRWFERDRELPTRAISIINAGPRQIEWTDPELLDVVNNGAAQTDVVWGLGYATQPLQLDVWAQTDIDLDDIVARLDIHLNAGRAPYEESVDVTNFDPVGVGVLLALGDGWDPGTVDFTFDSTDAEPAPDEVMQGQWRATIRGVANMRLVVKATSSRMATILLKQRLRTTDPADATAPFQTTTINSSS